jgi:hypothetical protein
MIRYYSFIYFCNAVKLVFIHKTFTTFGYRQVVLLETCLNLLILWFLIIFYRKKLENIYLKFKKILSKKFLNVVVPLNWQKLTTRRNIN